jgi:hypothetical protein
MEEDMVPVEKHLNRMALDMVLATEKQIQHLTSPRFS